MSAMKCPFCQQELEINDLDVQLLGCENQNCKHSIHYDTIGTKELWQELIYTRKALDVAVKSIKLDKEFAKYMRTELSRAHKTLEIAVDTLKYIRRTNPLSFHFEAIEKALEQITALEQKDVK